MLKQKYRAYGRCYVDGEGREYPSVTSILNVLAKPFLTPWQLKMMEGEIKSQLICSIEGTCELNIEKIIKNAKKAADNYRDEKGAIGTKIHHIIEKRFNNQDISEERKADHKISAIMFQIEKWIKENELSPLLVEAYLVSKKHGYAGACDLVAKQNTKRHGEQIILVDFKTGSTLTEESQWQLAAYAACYNETYGKIPDISFLLHIDVEHQTIAEEFHLHNYDVPEKFGEFLDIFSAFKAKWKRELEKNKQ
jgi:hypothetical protein